MAETTAEALSNIENSEKLKIALNGFPIEMRGKIAELAGKEYDRKFDEANKEGYKFKDEPEPCIAAQGIMKALTKMVRVLNLPETCYSVALKSYKDTGDKEGIKRIGDAYAAIGHSDKAISIYKSLGEGLDSERKAFIEKKIAKRQNDKSLKRKESEEKLNSVCLENLFS